MNEHLLTVCHEPVAIAPKPLNPHLVVDGFDHLVDGRGEGSDKVVRAIVVVVETIDLLRAVRDHELTELVLLEVALSSEQSECVSYRDQQTLHGRGVCAWSYIHV